MKRTSMPGYTILHLQDAPNFFEKKGWPGEMRFLSKPLGTEQVAVSYRRMPQHSGGKGGYGHRHKTQEEVIFLFKGELEIKLDDEVKVVKAPAAVRIAPEVVRSLWNEQPEDAELLIISTVIEDLDADAEFIKDFWPV